MKGEKEAAGAREKRNVAFAHLEEARGVTGEGRSNKAHSLGETH